MMGGSADASAGAVSWSNVVVLLVIGGGDAGVGEASVEKKKEP